MNLKKKKIFWISYVIIVIFHSRSPLDHWNCHTGWSLNYTLQSQTTTNGSKVWGRFQGTLWGRFKYLLLVSKGWRDSLRCFYLKVCSHLLLVTIAIFL
jgi:hypothetical protein